jgi:hypothetical protein
MSNVIAIADRMITISQAQMPDEGQGIYATSAKPEGEYGGDEIVHKIPKALYDEYVMHCRKARMASEKMDDLFEKAYPWMERI